MSTSLLPLGGRLFHILHQACNFCCSFNTNIHHIHLLLGTSEYPWNTGIQQHQVLVTVALCCLAPSAVITYGLSSVVATWDERHVNTNCNVLLSHFSFLGKESRLMRLLCYQFVSLATSGISWQIFTKFDMGIMLLEATWMLHVLISYNE
jgi:hypothetical protein